MLTNRFKYRFTPLALLTNCQLHVLTYVSAYGINVSECLELLIQSSQLPKSIRDYVMIVGYTVTSRR